MCEIVFQEVKLEAAAELYQANEKIYNLEVMLEAKESETKTTKHVSADNCLFSDNISFLSLLGVC